LDKVLKEGGQEGWKKVVQAYLACTTFADACLGMVLDALESSPHRDNTIIVLWSDHGWHLGEKEHIQKFTLWERGTKSNLMIYAPKITPKAGARYPYPVSLVDIFPTVCELAKVPLKSSLTGESLVPYLKNPTKVKTSPMLTTWEPGNFAIRTLDYRYIRYSDGEEELYDHRNDSHEFKNLAKSPEYANILKQHRTHLPSNSVEPNPPVSKSALKKEEHKKKKLAKLVERSLKK
jgi:arylsulfatase A-like enzyme